MSHSLSSDSKEISGQPLDSNHTIWHTAAVSRDEQPLEYRRDIHEKFQSKKRRVSCGIEIVKCQICGLHFDSPAQLSDHLVEHDRDYCYAPIYKCSYGQCMFRTDDRPVMKYHIAKIHLKSDQALISKKFRTRKLLRPTILCSTCPMVFATERELWNHSSTCKDYRCQFCGQHFWTIEKRYAHEMIYHEDEFEEETQEKSPSETLPSAKECVESAPTDENSSCKSDQSKVADKDISGNVIDSGTEEKTDNT